MLIKGHILMDHQLIWFHLRNSIYGQICTLKTSISRWYCIFGWYIHMYTKWFSPATQIADFRFIVFLWARFHFALTWQLLSVSAQAFMYPRRTSFKSIRLRRTDWTCMLPVFKESALLKVEISCWIHAVHFSTTAHTETCCEAEETRGTALFIYNCGSCIPEACLQPESCCSNCKSKWFTLTHL